MEDRSKPGGIICGEKTKREQIIEKDQQIAFKY